MTLALTKTVELKQGNIDTAQQCLIKKTMQDALLALQSINLENPHIPTGESGKNFIPQNIRTLEDRLGDEQNYTEDDKKLGEQRLQHIDALKKILHI